jgi:zinc protease
VQDGWSRFPATNHARRQQYCSVWIRPVKAAHAHFALRAAVRELEALVANGIPPAELEGTRTFARRYYQLYTQTESRRLGFALDARFYGMERPPVDTLRDAWAGVTGPQIAEALRQHVDPSRLSIAIVAPRATELADAIGAEAPSPITYDAPKPDDVLAEDRTTAAHPLGIARDRIQVVPVAEVFRR